MFHSENFSIKNTTKGKLPRLPFELLKKEILGEKYSLSIAFVGTKKSKEINNTYRQKNYPANVLSFALSKKEGELILCPAKIKKETAKFEKDFNELLLFMVIHGLLHLKGMQHNAKMEREEKKYYEKYFHWNRSRIIKGKDRSSRNIKRRKIS